METSNTTSPAGNQQLIDRIESLETRLAKIERTPPEPNDYNGWSNYETWAVSLWMDNDAEQYLRNRALAEKHLKACGWKTDEAVAPFADALKEQIEDGVPSYLKGMYVDLMNGALSQVNYFEIARNWLESIDPPSGEPDKPADPEPSAPMGKEPSGKFAVKASAEVLDVLARSAIGDDGLTLPPEQLPPEDYAAVNKFLKLAGAKWDKKTRRHLFTEPDTKQKLDALLGSGQIIDEKKQYQAFYTPADAARRLAEIAQLEPDMDCLEPSAGEGTLAEALRPGCRSVSCIELNPKAAAVLREKGFAVEEADFLSVTPEPRYDRVVMNPPFTNNQDIDHVMHAFQFLKEGGKLVAIMSKGFLSGEQKKRAEFRRFLEANGRVVCELPEGTFEESGTMVATVVIELRK